MGLQREMAALYAANVAGAVALAATLVRPPARPTWKPLVKTVPIMERTVVKTKPDVGRNDPCPCASGKKFKKCCLNEAA